MNCPACGFECPDGLKFCGSCGHRLPAACGSCGSVNPEGFRFCGQCGSPLEPAGPSGASKPAERAPRDYTPRHLADKILQSRSAVEGERKFVSVLFADVKGSLELAEQVDPEEWHRILDRFFRILTDGVHRFEGTVNQYTGDGIMALFGAPIAHEDHAQRACYAALAIRTALREYADQLRRTHGLSFATRIGVNSGEVVVGKIGDDLRMDYTAQGHTVGLAQRMEELAEPGSAFLTAHTGALVEGYFALRPLGAFALRGVSESLDVYALEGVGALRTRLDRSRARGFSRFVGRGDEVASLEAALARAQQGNGQVVGVVAEAGVGKSRLCLEFLESCRAAGIPVHEAHCPAHGKTIPLLPIYELLRNVFGLSEADRARVAREKIAGRLLLLDRDFETDLPLIWDFLGVPDAARPAVDTDANTRQHQLHAFVRRLVRTRSQHEAAVVFFDDLHWIDPASDAYLEQLVGVVHDTRTLVLTNFRPEYHASWMQRSYYQQLALAPLGPADIRALAADLLGPDESVARLPDKIAARTGGNPFFTEEVVQSLVESGKLTGSRGDHRLKGRIASIRVPTSVQAVLSARIDRLPAREKRVLQTAAVIGKEFTGSVLQQIVDCSEEELRGALATLQDGEFIHERAIYPEVEYAFKHPLTQEVAYNSQLADRRKPLHAAVAKAIEARDPERAEENAALLAYHWDGADEIEPAAKWHRLAANRVGVVQLEEVIRHWTRVRELVERLPDGPEKLARASEAQAQLLWFESRRRSGFDAEHGRRLIAECRDLARRSGDRGAITRADLSASQYLFYHGEEKEAMVLAERAIAEADAIGDRELRVAARWPAIAGGYFSGALEPTIRSADEAIELCAGDLGVGHGPLGFSPAVLFRGIRGASFAYLGRRAEAATEFDRLFEASYRSYAYSFHVVRSAIVVFHWLEGDFRAGHAQVSQSIEALTELGNPASDAFSFHYLGLSFALLGEWDRARDALDRSLRTQRDNHVFLQQEAETVAWLARVEAERGELDLAEQLLEQSQQAARRSDSRMGEPIGHFARARILWHRRKVKAAEAIEDELQQALEAARAIGARLYEPFFLRERAAVQRARGDEARWRQDLEHAQQLFLEMQAASNAERTARELARTRLEV